MVSNSSYLFLGPTYKLIYTHILSQATRLYFHIICVMPQCFNPVVCILFDVIIYCNILHNHHWYIVWRSQGACLISLLWQAITEVIWLLYSERNTNSAEKLAWMKWGIGLDFDDCKLDSYLADDTVVRNLVMHHISLKSTSFSHRNHSHIY